MNRQQNVKRAPKRFYDGAPPIVVNEVAAIFGPFRDAICPYDVILRATNDGEISGLDFDNSGYLGNHFFLSKGALSAYRERNKNKRIAWRELPERTRAAIVAYLESDR